MNNIVIIIPSRLNAERLPNKPLKLINNKEMILHVHATAKNSNVGQVIVATPDQEILELVKKIMATLYSQVINIKQVQIVYLKCLKKN